MKQGQNLVAVGAQKSWKVVLIVVVRGKIITKQYLVTHRTFLQSAIKAKSIIVIEIRESWSLTRVSLTVVNRGNTYVGILED